MENTCNTLELSDVYQTLYNLDCTLVYIQIQKLQPAPNVPQFSMSLGVVTGTGIERIILYYTDEAAMLADRSCLADMAM